MPNPTDRLIIGTAGHIDHGKSTLVEALTGVDPDRLKDEKERGITIVLGFAPLDLPSGRRCGLVDVPGHERLVRTMIAGASGIDVLLFVVSADEGTMPQTREHLAICKLLGIQSGVVALTKKDLVDQEWLDLVVQDLSEELKGSFLEKAPIVPCSSTTGEGLEELLASLDKVAARAKRRDPDGLLRMPIDRIFTMKGFGTVVTGTLVSGKMSTGDHVEILPSGIRDRVRSLQVHGDSVNNSDAGTRTAVNLQSSETMSINRGQWIVHPSSIEPSHRIDIEITLLPIIPRPLKHRSTVLIHAGTAQVDARIHLFDSDSISPGGTAFAHAELSSPLVVLPGDRLILRGSEMLEGHGHTIGGGEVIRPQAKRPRKKSQSLDEIQSLCLAETDEHWIETIIDQSGLQGIELKVILQKTKAGPQATRQSLKKLTKAAKIIAFGQAGYLHSKRLDILKTNAEAKLDDFHTSHPLDPGMPREELRSKLHGTSPALFGLVLEHLKRKGDVVVEKDTIRKKDFKPTRAGNPEKIEALKGRIVERLHQAGLTPPRDKDLSEEFDLDIGDLQSTLKLLVGEGKVAKITEGLHFSMPHIQDLETKIVQHFETNDKLTAQQFKAITGASRKFSIPLVEYFDKEKLTMRVGDARVLRRR